MASARDLERDGLDSEPLLAKEGDQDESLRPVEAPATGKRQRSERLRSQLKLAAAFGAGIACCVAGQAFFPVLCIGSTSRYSSPDNALNVVQSTFVGSKVSHTFPAGSPTNAYPSLFPTDVGFPGDRPTGIEAGLVATAARYPMHTGAPHLLAPSSPPSSRKGSKSSWNSTFDIFQHWGNLSPWFSVPSFGLDSNPDAPEGCSITNMHLLHRHGARYPTARAPYGGPEKFAEKLRKTAANGTWWEGTGPLKFLNGWTYKLGAELLTPFGRQQLLDLGVSMRIKYGFLLQDFTEKQRLPVFRTESQDRMLYSALNFAIGFFGYPHQDKYQQLITIESGGFNNTLAPYYTCPNANKRSKSERAIPYLRKWVSIYLADARDRLNGYLTGMELTLEDVYILQQTCAYETVALGYSAFCELFTEEEWVGFDYALDLYFWYSSAFGSPVARIQGVGWVTELISRLTETRIPTHNTSTNGTLDDNDTTFPFGHSLYVDATHEVVFLNILTALNLTSLSKGGHLPADHIPENRSFRSSELAPFATNMQLQVLSCPSTPEPQVRIIVNDGVVPLTGVKGCPEDKHGMCPVDTFVSAQKELLATADWDWACNGDWEVPPGDEWQTVTGDPPARPH